MARRGQRRDYTEEDYQKIKKENKKKLDKIFDNPNFQEELGRKYYGDSWLVTLYGDHPDKVEARKASTKKAQARAKGEKVPFKLRWNQKPINQYTLDGKLVKKWNSSLEWCEANNQPVHKANSLVKAARGFADTGYKHIWKFENEEDEFTTKKL